MGHSFYIFIYIYVLYMLYIYMFYIYIYTFYICFSVKTYCYHYSKLRCKFVQGNPDPDLYITIPESYFSISDKARNDPFYPSLL